MKKIFLTCLVALSIFAADAQTKKGHKKSGKKPNKEAIAKARFAKQEQEKKLARQAGITAMLSEDSVRVQADSIADVQMETDRLAYKETGLKVIDSMNKETYKALSSQRGEWEKAERTQSEVSKAAKLSEYESKQVKYINQTYNARARALIQNTDPQQKKQELFSLNEERRAKIKIILGKSKERKLEKERKEYFQKNGADADSQWVDIAESVAKK